VEVTYNLRGVTPCTTKRCYYKWVEVTYNLRGVTPGYEIRTT